MSLATTKGREDVYSFTPVEGQREFGRPVVDEDCSGLIGRYAKLIENLTDGAFLIRANVDRGGTAHAASQRGVEVHCYRSHVNGISGFA